MANRREACAGRFGSRWHWRENVLCYCAGEEEKDADAASSGARMSKDKA